MKKDLRRLSKFMAVALRHSPAKFGIELDEQGFTSIDSLWEAIGKKFGGGYSLSDLDYVVTNGDKNNKKRYEIVDTQIRAMYGHSKPEITYPIIEPPEILFHGTNPNALEDIRKQGLIAGKRQYVHMTTNMDNAKIVAARRTAQPIILRIRAKEASKNNIAFHQPEDEHYLAKSIPAEYIMFSTDGG